MGNILKSMAAVAECRKGRSLKSRVRRQARTLSASLLMDLVDFYFCLSLLPLVGYKRKLLPRERESKREQNLDCVRLVNLVP